MSVINLHHRFMYKCLVCLHYSQNMENSYYLKAIRYSYVKIYIRHVHNSLKKTLLTQDVDVFCKYVCLHVSLCLLAVVDITVPCLCAWLVYVYMNVYMRGHQLYHNTASNWKQKHQTTLTTTQKVVSFKMLSTYLGLSPALETFS